MFLSRYWLKAARFHEVGSRSCKLGSLSSGAKEKPSSDGLILALSPVRSNAVGYLRNKKNSLRY